MTKRERDKSINLSKYDAKNERRNGQKRTAKLTENREGNLTNDVELSA